MTCNNFSYIIKIIRQVKFFSNLLRTVDRRNFRTACVHIYWPSASAMDFCTWSSCNEGMLVPPCWFQVSPTSVLVYNFVSYKGSMFSLKFWIDNIKFKNRSNRWNDNFNDFVWNILHSNISTAIRVSCKFFPVCSKFSTKKRSATRFVDKNPNVVVWYRLRSHRVAVGSLR